MPKVSAPILEMAKKLGQVAPVYADIFVERVKARTPEITGTLRKAWKAEQGTASTINIGNDTEYALYVEYGTSRMAPRGMLRATMLERDQILAEAVKKVGL